MAGSFGGLGAAARAAMQRRAGKSASISGGSKKSGLSAGVSRVSSASSGGGALGKFASKAHGATRSSAKRVAPRGRALGLGRARVHSARTKTSRGGLGRKRTY